MLNPLATSAVREETARAVWWNGPPWSVLRNGPVFLWQVMDFGSDAQIEAALDDIETSRWNEALVRLCARARDGAHALEGVLRPLLDAAREVGPRRRVHVAREAAQERYPDAREGGPREDVRAAPGVPGEDEAMERWDVGSGRCGLDGDRETASKPRRRDPRKGRLLSLRNGWPRGRSTPRTDRAQ